MTKPCCEKLKKFFPNEKRQMFMGHRVQYCQKITGSVLSDSKTYKVTATQTCGTGVETGIQNSESQQKIQKQTQT